MFRRGSRLRCIARELQRTNIQIVVYRTFDFALEAARAPKLPLAAVVAMKFRRCHFVQNLGLLREAKAEGNQIQLAENAGKRQ